MVCVVVEAVGLLTPPRKFPKGKAVLCEQNGRSKHELFVDCQARLRALILSLLGSGLHGRLDSGLDLTDDGTRRLLKLPLQRIRFLLGDLVFDGVSCERHWVALAKFLSEVRIASCPLDVCERPRHAKRVYERRAEFVTGRGGPIQWAIRKAFEHIGADATAYDIINTVRETHSIWSEVGHKLNQSPNKHRTRRGGEVWMANLRGNLTRLCKPTGERRDGKTLWRLESATKPPVAKRPSRAAAYAEQT
eukprot:TRINITY_DN29781_c0_g1_i1.p2 TRINITY_DN29781_c0_g1~~TRINITY_DN29781_c0_g1_i1.p2  ORF type:complete len:276 (+),score=28.92 TRINITY_DN29781_c0_g1_i1:85-828(+)